jgi:hypothetical protein
MSDLAFEQIFGNAVETPTTILLYKGGLPMTAAASNGGEQVFAAIIKKAKPFLSVEKFPANLDQNITIEDGITDRQYRKENNVDVPYLRTQVIVSFYKRDVDRVGGIFPDEY